MGHSTVCTIVISTCNTIATHLFPWYVCFPTGDHLRDIITNFETCWGFPQTVDIDCIRSSCLISAFHLLYFNSASGFLLFSSHLCALSSACSSISALTPLELRVSFHPNTTLKLVRPKDWTPQKNWQELFTRSHVQVAQLLM